MVGNYDENSDIEAMVTISWSTADVKGVNRVGGLFGDATSGIPSRSIGDNWAAGNVSGEQFVGGFAGIAENNVYDRNWSSGAVSGGTEDVGGFLGNGGSRENTFAASNYWDLNTSGVTVSDGGVGIALQTLSSVAFGDDAAVAWDFGGNNDFPLLTVFSQPLQAVYLTRALTRILPLSDNLARDALTAGSEQALEANGFRLDTNGLAANDGSDSTPIPTCSFDNDSGVLRAITNYNGTAVEMSLLAGGGERLTLPSGCDVKIGGVTDVFDATLRLEISAPEGNAMRRLTVDYGMHIAPLLEFDDFPNPATVAADAARNTQVLTISANQSFVTFTLEDNDSANFAIDRSSNVSSNEVAINIRNLATAVFDENGKRATIIVAATRFLTNTNNLTVVFVSAPLAISSADSFIDINIMNASVGATILASINSGLTIWHNDNDDEFYTINSAGNFLTVGGTSGDVTAVEDLQIGVDYVATLSLTDSVSGVAAMRVLTVSVSEGLAIRTPRQPVAVALGVARDTAVYTAILLGGEDDRSFDSVSTGDFQTGGGEDEAEITITRTAADVFATDGAIGEIVLTASDEMTVVTATIRFVSAPLVFTAALFERSLSESEARASGFFLAANSTLSIWHSDNNAERYELIGAGNNFTVDEITGEVRIARNLSAGVYSFTLNLIAANGVERARRDLRLVVTRGVGDNRADRSAGDSGGGRGSELGRLYGVFGRGDGCEVVRSGDGWRFASE